MCEDIVDGMCCKVIWDLEVQLHIICIPPSVSVALNAVSFYSKQSKTKLEGKQFFLKISKKIGSIKACLILHLPIINVNIYGNRRILIF